MLIHGRAPGCGTGVKCLINASIVRISTADWTQAMLLLPTSVSATPYPRSSPPDPSPNKKLESLLIYYYNRRTPQMDRACGLSLFTVVRGLSR